MAKNEFLPFGIAEGANVLSNQEYERLAARFNGFVSGVAKSKELNTVWRQSSVMSSALAQFIVDSDNKDLLDNGDVTSIKNRFVAAIKQTISGVGYVTTAAMNLELNKKFDKANISGVKGNDNDKVPSLNLFTTEVGKLQPKGNYQEAGYSYSKEESDNNYQPKGEYAPAGNYASADYFAQIGTYSMMESPNHSYRLVIHNDGRVSAHDNTNGGAAIIGFSSSGEMTVGSVPASRVTGLVVNELGQSTTQVISQRTATNSFALSEFFGSGSSDSWVRSPSKKSVIQITDVGEFNFLHESNYAFSVSSNGEISNGSINASRVTGLFSKYTDVTSQRSSGVSYTNPENKPMFVSISFGNTNGDLIATVNGVVVYSTGNTSNGVTRMSAFFIVPPRGTYKIESPAGFNLWSECA